MLSVEVAATNAARKILEDRVAAARSYLLPTDDDRLLSLADVRQRVLVKNIAWSQSARLQLIVAREAVERMLPAPSGKPWSGRYAHAMARHFLLSAADPRAPVAEQGALLAAAFEMKNVLGDTTGRDGARKLIDQLGVEPGDYDWAAALGVAADEFGTEIQKLQAGHRLFLAGVASGIPLPAAAATDEAWLAVVRRERVAVAAASAVRRTADSRPQWLTLGAGGDLRGMADAAWPSATTAQSAEADLDDCLVEAWDEFTAGRIVEADGLLAEVYSSAGRDWAPPAGPDGLLLWAWLRLVRYVATARTVDDPARRLAAVSAAEMLTRIEPGARQDDLLGEMIGAALADLAPGNDGPLAHSFAVYSARIAAAHGHETLWSSLDYTNVDRARARAVWSREFPRSGITARQSSADSAEVLSGLYHDFRRAAVQLQNQAGFEQRHVDALRVYGELLDHSERSHLDTAITLLTEAVRAERPDGAEIRVPDLRSLRERLLGQREEIAESGSLLLQEALNPALLIAAGMVDDLLNAASRQSRPELESGLISVRLPLSSRAGGFPCMFRVRNTGNSSARDIGAALAADGLQTDESPARVGDLAPGAESHVIFQVSSAAPASAATLNLRLTWADDIGQEFDAKFAFTAEDQRPSQWTTSDVNPYSLSSISVPERLVGRDQELAVLDSVLRMSDSTYVTGFKRVGKSSLVRTLLGRLGREPGWAVVTLELGMMLGTSASPASLALSLIDGVAEALVDVGLDLTLQMSETTSDDYARFAGRWLRRADRAIAAVGGVHVVVAIDDFDGIPRDLVEGEGATGLFLFLRSLVDRPWLSLVLIGSEMMPAVIAKQSYHLNQVRQTLVEVFQFREATARLLREPSSERLEWSDAAIDLVHQMCDGNPYYATLIAQRLWSVLRNVDRTQVEFSDVQDAVVFQASTVDQSHFSHMWSDDPDGMAPKSRRAMLQAALLLSVARCATTALSSAGRDEVVQVAQRLITEVTADELTAALRILVTRGVLHTPAESRDVAIRVPLFAEWLRRKGRQELENEYAQFTRARSANLAVKSGELIDLTHDLNYAGRRVSEILLDGWLDQFGEDLRDRRLMFLLAQRMIQNGFFDAGKLNRTILPRVVEKIRQAVPELKAGRGSYLSNAVILQHGRPGSSGPAVVTQLHSILRVKKENCVTLDQLRPRIEAIPAPVLIVLDDFVGTGKQLAGVLEEAVTVLDRSGGWRNKAVIVAGAAVAAETRILKEQFDDLDLRIVTGVRIGNNLRAFHEDAKIFSTTEDRLRAADLAEVIGRSLVPDAPLGWSGQGLLVLFENNCPNNSLPIFWSSGRYGGKQWRPLFPRHT